MGSKQVLIRVDSSSVIGSGHIQRCLALAEGLRELDVVVRFVSRLHPGHLGHLVEKAGFALDRLPPARGELRREPSTPRAAYSNWLGASQVEDAVDTVAVARETGPNLVLVDHYGVAHEWETAVARHFPVMTIDDLADRSYGCDLLLDQNYWSKGRHPYKRLTPSRCDLLVGPAYALLRPEFRRHRGNANEKRRGRSRLLVSFGGSDVENLTSRCLRILSKPMFSSLEIDVVVGQNNPHIPLVEELVIQSARLALFVQTPKMAELMARADFAIGAGGSTTWERLCVSLPSLVISVADNQVRFCQHLARDGYIKYLGASKSVQDSKIRAALADALSGPVLEAGAVRAGASLVDGQGTARVAREMLSFIQSKVS
ncbi:MAG: UDP-2,4-diacetamido-2,4,6-trideoxy-beta-L-altropyranose hydrolase [Rhodothermales bacterium]|nr:UDP-2,4-diacetamido-2,4,6-trideoxy-beta-L-altropyranose hydrolase [Rhodothermales bacterium]MBO6781039.1 UDP-2,4-diacetamido-2,4,6-trideoxy-beta-L-altropyranose hydrolase [Rhodothermales bacterium]